MEDRRIAGIVYMMAGISSFATMDALGKWLVRDYSVLQILAVRSSFVMLMLIALLPLSGGRDALRSSQMSAHWARSLCSIAAFLFFFTSVRYLPLADAVAVAFGGPFIVTALSVPLLGEHVDGRRWLAIGIGFCGMLLIVQPTGAGFRPAALLVIAASFCYSILMILTRWMSKRSGGQEKAYTFVFYTFVLQSVCGWAGVALVGEWRSMSLTDVGFSAAMGAFALGGHFGITRAFQLAPVSVVAPFEYTALVFATVLGFLVFHEFPSADVWLGVAVIVVSGLYAIHREGAPSS